MRHTGARNVVFSGACATYGVPEDAVHTKLLVERVLKNAEATYGIRHVALRY
jgi:UDP-glucose 4-epimerase